MNDSSPTTTTKKIKNKIISPKLLGRKLLFLENFGNTSPIQSAFKVDAVNKQYQNQLIRLHKKLKTRLYMCARDMQ